MGPAVGKRGREMKVAKIMPPSHELLMLDRLALNFVREVYIVVS
jgi:hypothetical protein